MTRRRAGFVALWEYRVRPEHAADFERVYGPAGDWARLFRSAPGYIETALCRDARDALRYVTLDRWDSEQAWRAFRERFAGEYEALDAACAAWTTSERELGRFAELA